MRLSLKATSCPKRVRYHKCVGNTVISPPLDATFFLDLQTMALKLWTNPANFRAFKVLIAAEYNGVELEVPEFNHPSDSKSPDFLAKSPLGRVPVLETPQVWNFVFDALCINRLFPSASLSRVCLRHRNAFHCALPEQYIVT